jgi:hypothetical protein
VPAASGAVGTNVIVSAVGSPVAAATVPATGGEICSAARTAPTSTGRSNVRTNAVLGRTVVPRAPGTVTVPEVERRVRNDARTGAASAEPAAARAVGPTVTV